MKMSLPLFFFCLISPSTNHENTRSGTEKCKKAVAISDYQ